MKLPNGTIWRCNLHYVLLVQKLAYNLLSVSKAAEAGMTTKFDEIVVRYSVGTGKSLW